MNKDKAAIQRDFSRTVVSLLGVPIDELSLIDTQNQIFQALDTRSLRLLSTANLSFILLARRDKDFRKSLINSDIVTIDGIPPLWIARILGITKLHKVSGSDLFENLMRRCDDPPLKVYLFGGDGRVAEEAHTSLNRSNKGVISVGYNNPGIGTAEELASTANINAINAANPDFLVVSLGAKKGQRWLLESREKLDVSVASHLGAVINFVAGNVRRAPKIMQNFGMEWLWRIKEQPRLFTRYFGDGWRFLWLLIFVVRPYANFKRNALKLEPSISSERFHATTAPPRERQGSSTQINLTLSGSLSHENAATIKEIFETAAAYDIVRLDIKEVTHIDEYGFGLLLLLIKYTGENLTIISCPDNLKPVFEFEGLSYALASN